MASSWPGPWTSTQGQNSMIAEGVTLKDPLASVSPKCMRAVRAFDRRLARAFERQAQTLSAESTAALGSTARLNSPLCLSGAAQRENFRKQQYELQMGRAEEAAEIPVPSRGRAESETLLLLQSGEIAIANAEAFESEAKEMDHRIEDLSKSIRFEHLAERSSAENRKRAEQEAERRRREELQRRDRKREQEANTPQMKIALRIESRRRMQQEDSAFPLEPEDKRVRRPRIPMSKVEVYGQLGAEMIDMVDIRVLRSKCIGLDDGVHSVSSLLETHRRKEKMRVLTGTGKRSLGTSSSAPNLSSSDGFGAGTSRESWMSADSVDERLARALAKREAGRVSDILKKLDRMRNDLPYSLPYQFEIALANERRHLMISRKKKGKQNPDGDGMELAKQLLTCVSPDGDRLKAGRSSVLHRLMTELHAAKLLPRPSVCGASQKQSLRALLMQQRAAEEAQCRARHHWLIARALVKFIMLFVAANRRQNAVEPMKCLLFQLGEWARMKYAMRRTIKGVTVIQSHVRYFLATKAKRCEHIHQEWIRVEDGHLSTYFKAYVQKAMQEQAVTIGKVRRKAVPNFVEAQQHRDFMKQLQEGVEVGSLLVEWRNYRIPTKERTALISRCYMALLRKQVQASKNLVGMVRSAVQGERDLITFLRQLGASEAQANDGHLRSTLAVNEVGEHHRMAFWQLSESAILQLIALAAQLLLKGGHPHFAEHPANKDLPTQVSVRSRRASASVLPVNMTSSDASNVRLELINSECIVHLGRLGKIKPVRRRRNSDASVSSRMDEEEGDADESDERRKSSFRRVSVEDLFRHFTPRLKEMVEAEMSSTTERAVTPATGGPTAPSRNTS